MTPGTFSERNVRAFKGREQKQQIMRNKKQGIRNTGANRLTLT
jgi:hypothetical protein